MSPGPGVAPERMVEDTLEDEMKSFGRRTRPTAVDDATETLEKKVRRI